MKMLMKKYKKDK